MKQFKWIPVSQLIKEKKPEKKRLFNGVGDADENSRTSLGMDEDSNMSNMSTGFCFVIVPVTFVTSCMLPFTVKLEPINN